MSQICGWYQSSRQAHYQQKWRESQQQQQADQVLELVRAMRQRHSRMGARKLYHELPPELHQRGLQMGRDRFFALLREYNLLLRPKKRATRTTWAGRWRCENLLVQTDITHPNRICK
ncbi:MAG: hypothetical protein KDJ97_11300 [Anaerolineae bacterium]|nr:hypothetical protein [Anaerolineae bacterium]